MPGASGLAKLPTETSQVTPYREGVAVRRVRLAPNPAAAVRAHTATITPAMAVRTGTAVRPRPGSRASRTPATAGGRKPAERGRRPAATAVRAGELGPPEPAWCSGGPPGGQQSARIHQGDDCDGA